MTATTALTRPAPAPRPPRTQTRAAAKNPRTWVCSDSGIVVAVCVSLLDVIINSLPHNLFGDIIYKQHPRHKLGAPNAARNHEGGARNRRRSTPKSMRVRANRSLPANCKTPEQIREWFEKRVKYRWSVNKKFKDGRIQFGNALSTQAGSKPLLRQDGKRRQPAKNDLKLSTRREPHALLRRERHPYSRRT